MAFHAECVAAAADGEASLLASAMSAIGMTDTSPPPAPPPPQEPNWVAGGIFLGVLGFCCVTGILYVCVSFSNFKAEEDEKKRMRGRR